jgi:hypothetical protein
MSFYANKNQSIQLHRVLDGWMILKSNPNTKFLFLALHIPEAVNPVNFIEIFMCHIKFIKEYIV